MLQQLSVIYRIIYNLSWTIISEATSKFIFFLVNIYLARTLNVELFGLLSFSITIVNCVWLAVDLGIGMYGIREIAKYKNNAEHIINTLISIRIASGLIVFFLYIFIIWQLNISALHKYVFLGCGIYLFSYSFYTDWIFKGLEKFNEMAYGSIISALLYFLLTIFFVHRVNDIIAAAIIWGIAPLFGSSIFIFLLSKKINLKLSFEFSTWKKHLKESLFIMLSGFLMILYRYYPVIIIKYYYSAYNVGIFNASYSVITVITNAGFLVAMAYFPILSELYENDKIKFYKIHFYYQLIMIGTGVFIGILCIIFSTFIIKIAFGSQYLDSVKIFALQAWLIPLSFFRYTIGTVLLATGFHRLNFFANSTSAIVMLVIGTILIKHYDIVGCVWGMIISEFFMSIILVMLSKYTFKNKIYSTTNQE